MPAVLPAVALAVLALTPVALACAALGAQPAPAVRRAAPAWNDSATLDLVRRAERRRRRDLADTALRDYRAVARGTLTLLGQVGEGFTEPPRVVQTAQVATEVYWRTPGVSRQVVVGARDTTLLPTDNRFYRDRYAIVVDNFPDVIRVGEGRDVADVPHPLSEAGLALYDFAAGDSLGIRIGTRTLRVLELRVRPRDPSRPAFVGSLFVERADAQPVRLAFTFTRASYLDPRNEDVSIVLENALVEGRFWLPRRQEVEVRRTGTFLDFPARGIIRGRWDVGDYRVNAGFPDSLLPRPALAFAPPSALRAYPFRDGVLDALPPDARLATAADVERVRALATATVQGRALARARGGAVSARSVSDFVRVTRAEGLALGAGVVARPGAGVTVGVRGRYGVDDRALKGRVAAGWARPSGTALRLEVARDYREAGDAAEVSRARNTLAAQEFGSDWTDPFDVRSATVAVDAPAGDAFGGARLGAGVSYETHRGVRVRARPFTGRYEPTLAAAALRAVRADLGAAWPVRAFPLGTTGSAELRVAAARTSFGCGGPAGDGGARLCADFARASAAVRGTRAFGANQLAWETIAAGAAGRVPPQELALLGGPVTGPGYAFHALSGRAGVSQRVEWRVPVPFPAISLGRYGRAPAAATLAPYAHLSAVWRPELVRVGAPPAASGAYPALGAGLLTFFDLVRVDVARGVGRGGRWMFSVDVTREFWRVL